MRRFFNTDAGTDKAGGGDANATSVPFPGWKPGMPTDPIKAFEQQGKELEIAQKKVGRQLADLLGTEDVTAMGFDLALLALKRGHKVARAGWSGKGMFLYLVPGSQFKVSEGRPLAAHLPVGSDVTYHAHIDMKTAQDTHVPWLASQTDVLAEDWQIL